MVDEWVLLGIQAVFCFAISIMLKTRHEGRTAIPVAISMVLI